jgi:hypothetical protein
MGKNKIRGHNKYKIPESQAAFEASFSVGDEMYRVAKLQLPPL